MKQKGIILVIVLWVLFFLSVSALTLGFRNRINIKLRSLRNEELRMFLLAKEGISHLILMLAEDAPDFDALDENWAKDFSLQKDEGLLLCKVVDEDRFLNINTAPQELLNNIGALFPEVTAEHIEIINKKRPFNIKKEVLDITGIGPDVFYGNPGVGKTGIHELITVFSDGKLNINTASEETLSLVPQITESNVEAILDKRKNAPFEDNEMLSEELSLLGLTPAQVSSLIKFVKVNSSVFRIYVSADSSRKHISKKVELVLKREKDQFRVLLYKEN